MRYDVINDIAALQSQLFLHKKYPALGNSVCFIFIHNMLLMDLIRLPLLLLYQNNSSCAFGFPGILSKVLKYANITSGFVSMPFSLHRAWKIFIRCVLCGLITE